MFLAAQTFDVIAPATPPVLVALAILVIFAGVFIFLARIIVGMRKITFVVEGDSLKINAPVYGKTIAKSALKLDEARIITLKDTPEMQPTLKIGGTALPGAKIGRFKLRNGNTAVVYLTQGGSTLSVPTTEGYTLLLETPQATELLATLKGA